MVNYITNAFKLLKDTYQEWNKDGAPMLAAALAYYTAFSIAPLIILVVAIAGIVISQDTLQTQIIGEIKATAGEDAAGLVSDLVQSASERESGIISTVLGVGALMLGAMGVFTHLQKALDHIWDVNDIERPGGIGSFVRGKLLSFGMILVVGFLLLVSLILTTILTLMGNSITAILPVSEIFLQIISQLVSFGVTTVLFMFIFKFLPHADIEWRDVAVGAAVTALLFTIGKTVLGLYLGTSATASSYGAAGALAVVLLWVYYSAQIILFGAEFTQVFARRYGSKIVPDHYIKHETDNQQSPIEAATSA